MRLLLSTFCFFLFSLALYSQDIKSDLLGIWTFENLDSETGSFIYEPSRKMKRNEVAYEFRKDGVAIVRTNSMGCTVIKKNGKSISFLNNVEGTWKQLNTNTVAIYFETFMGHNNLIAELKNGSSKRDKKLFIKNAQVHQEEQ